MTDEFFNAERLIDWVQEAYQRSVGFTSDLTEQEMGGPQLEIVNPLLWEIGHVAWFYEKWVLCHTLACDPIRAGADQLYDSIAIAHDGRWDLPLPCREETLAYARQVRDRVSQALQADRSNRLLCYFVAYSVFHQDMHNEAYTYTRQTHGYRPPRFSAEASPVDRCRQIDSAAPPLGDAECCGGTFLLGAARHEPFVFDNEKWAHQLQIKPFAIARGAVTQAEFCAFVEDGGYRRQEFWHEEGWQWRCSQQAEQPVYWRRESDGHWLRRHFDRWLALQDDLPVLHVNWYEAQAYCRWAGRRLPSEAEWELAASCQVDREGVSSGKKRRYAWGDQPPSAARANLDWQADGAVPVGALAEGDSACGCRQMIGNVWEWTASTFAPYPGFEADPYKEYSQPWFQTRKVLRGGCWCTRSRMIRNTLRNYYTPERRDVWAGFRTCAAQD